jgi:TDG/mug DNA glycosylase family protein
MLPDILAPGLQVVICGEAAGAMSLERGHYYASPNNDFWKLLHESGLTPRRLQPDEDAMLLGYGIGLTDLDKGQGMDIPRFRRKMEHYRPAWVAVHSMKAARLLHPKPEYGPQPWRLADSKVFVLRSPSGAARGPKQLGSWREFADMVKEI